MCASVESTQAGVDAVSGPSNDTFVGVCASVEPTLAGVDVDAVGGPVVIYLLMCVLVLNQH